LEIDSLGVRARWVIIPTAKIPNNHRLKLDGSGVTVQVPGSFRLPAKLTPSMNKSSFVCVNMFTEVGEFKAIFHALIAPIEFVVIMKCNTIAPFRSVQLGESAVAM
jgi:hypothetical protein